MMRAPARALLLPATLAGVAALVFASAGLRLQKVTAAPQPVTWRKQVAPVIYRNCTGCHRAGGSGPFALETYEQARRWGSSIGTVVQSRYMPPWLPEPGHGDFAGSRRLPDAEVTLLTSWIAAGMPEGEGPAPQPPVFAGDWELGKPDLILTMAEPLHVPASGTDLFANFALPVPLTGTRWVRAMQIKPGTPQVVHHANVLIDRTASLRRTHPADWRAGVPGMDLVVDGGDRFDPDSHFLFWKPDSTALVEPEGMPWRLDPGNDLILNMHLKPTGKAETVQATIGLYFTDKPARQLPMLLQLEHDAAIHIPANKPDFVVEDSLKLPVGVDVLGIYPHAHYLGKRLEGWATLPDGRRRDLILITNWDIDRQSVYRFREPVALPAGAALHMRYVYDNTAANIHNPNSPPIAVNAGNRSADEMSHLWLQVLPHDPAGRRALQAAWMENRLSKDPEDPTALYNLAALQMMDGHPAEAAGLYARVLNGRPNDARTLTAIGSALAAAGDFQGAQTKFRAALSADHAYDDAAFDLASLDLNHDEAPEAETLLRRLVEAHPDDLAALLGLGQACLADEHPQAALPPLLHRLALHPDEAGEHFVALAFAASGDLEEALHHLQAWQRLLPRDPEPHRALAQVYSQKLQATDAIREQKLAVALPGANAGDWNDLGIMEARAGDMAAARRDLEHAAALDPGNAAIRGNLARLSPSAAAPRSQ